MKNAIKELGQKNIGELDKEIKSLRAEITKLKIEWAGNPPKDTNLLSKKKKRLSQILTVFTEKKEIEKLKK